MDRFFNGYNQFPADQTTHNTVEADQVQIQGINIRGSHNVAISQVEAQALVLIQAALQAAIEALIVVIDLDGSDHDLTKLQEIVQTLEFKQIEKEQINICDSDSIAISQIELQVAAVVQVAIELLAKITAKFLEA